MLNNTTTTRAAFIAKTFSLVQRDGMWVARGGYGGREFTDASKARVVFEARRHWGHFNYQDEAEAFAAIFPPEAARG